VESTPAYSALTPWAITLSSSTLELMKLAVVQVSVRVMPDMRRFRQRMWDRRGSIVYWDLEWMIGTIIKTQVPVEVSVVIGKCHTLSDDLLGFELLKSIVSILLGEQMSFPLSEQRKGRFERACALISQRVQFFFQSPIARLLNQQKRSTYGAADISTMRASSLCVDCQSIGSLELHIKHS
jgi:hypothetical protein